jgi:hypothetical protein
MKKIFAIITFVLFASFSYAQWTSSGSNIYNNAPATARVGVNITAPTELMHIYSAGTATGADGRAVYLAQSNYTGSALRTLGGFQANAANGDKFLMAFRHNGGGYQDMLQSVYINSSAAWAEFMYFRYDNQKWEMRAGVVDAEFLNAGKLLMNNPGGVGIGTTGIASGVKLQIGGKVKCQEVEVAVTPWPDHVFKAGYNLMPLNEVEAFINANSHLPGVPSEAEVANNGVNVGKMNATLLQKVEELTLYMIDLKKENDALKARVSNLEK